MVTQTQVVMPITQARIDELIQRGVLPEIAALDLEMIKMKMTHPNEELGWTPAQAESAELEYKRYLTLCVLFPHPAFSNVPNKIMDTMWHYHILDTRAYIRDCNAVFGGYFHHFPYFGLRDEADAQNLKNSFIDTAARYEKTFGEPIAREDQSSCWHDCKNRCWHACSDE